MSRFNVRKVAVLGAGVMGAQIAAHLVNVKVPVVLFDLPAKEGPKNGIVTRAVENLKKLKPAPLGVAEDAAPVRRDGVHPDVRQAPVAERARLGGDSRVSRGVGWRYVCWLTAPVSCLYYARRYNVGGCISVVTAGVRA